MSKVYNIHNLDFSIDQVSNRPEPARVLMTTPEFFDIVDVKNPHMEGQSGKLDKELAIKQWHQIKMAYKELVHRQVLDAYLEIQGVEGCEDMVFAANQTFPWITKTGEKVVIMSKMRHPSRQKEVQYFEKYFQGHDYKVIHLKKTNMFEGMGDAIPHYGKNLIYGGYGHRTDPVAYEEISELLDVPIVLLELVNDKFYHLDTCFIPLDENTVILCKEAFTEEGLAVINKLFSEVVEVPVEEAEKFFSLNAHIINLDGAKTAILHKGSTVTKNALQKKGFEIKEVDTSEFIKSGGSVFCMKMMVY
ncbi:arginine deiminase family protein [Cytophagaceae bacterium ABcell3]|nr:arginine deiminase family protein [Cytophagaceae bacterium ABcell3]